MDKSGILGRIIDCLLNRIVAAAYYEGKKSQPMYLYNNKQPSSGLKQDLLVEKERTKQCSVHVSLKYQVNRRMLGLRKQVCGEYEI